MNFGAFNSSKSVSIIIYTLILVLTYDNILHDVNTAGFNICTENHIIVNHKYIAKYSISYSMCHNIIHALYDLFSPRKFYMGPTDFPIKLAFSKSREVTCTRIFFYSD